MVLFSYFGLWNVPVPIDCWVALVFLESLYRLNQGMLMEGVGREESACMCAYMLCA